jgi:hypothetical protein
MWKRGCGSSWRFSYAWIRNRYYFLQSYCGILRCDSLFKAELSNTLGITIQKKQDPHRLYLLILQMASGKTISLYLHFIKVRTNSVLTCCSQGRQIRYQTIRADNAQHQSLYLRRESFWFLFVLPLRKSNEMNPPPDFKEGLV